ncbi:zinc-ribbon domain-containing protein [Desulfobacula sp.]|uniref:zinc-ribbon domain-containing protein n=1 Tax=Desulfobacula sp. TaxID=2593537 RepID=UPI0025C640FC|nr:zinc-ribbon domain-containing protein [Desulfobacula sp.]MBC2705674.1 zinc-ribbon domain-containing protein [Desulfobacula sp.]
MIITCNKCSTHFNLDDSLVKEDGSKVRCSVCKHVFTTFPLPQEPEQAPEESSDLSLDSFSDDGDTFEEPSDVETEESDFSLKSPDLETESSDLEMEETDLEIDDDFSFEETELEIDEDDESQELELEESHWEFEDDGIEFEDSGEEDFDSIEFESVEDEPDFLDSTESKTDLQDPDYQTFEEPLEKDSLADEDEFEFEFDIEDDSENEVPDIPDDKTDEGPFEEETEPEDDFLEEEILEEKAIIKEKAPVKEPETLMDTTQRSRKRKKKPLVGAPVLVILLIFFLVIVAYIASVMTGYKIPYLSDIKIPVIEQYFKKPVPEKLDVRPVPNQKSVNGRFVTNSTAGTLFVITGRVENLSNTDYNHIEIQGALITEGKVEAKTKNIFCGNIITEEMLKTGNISDINKLLAIKKGSHNSNATLKPGASIPFMVVFSDLPEKLQNFTVKVIKFEKTKNN